MESKSSAEIAASSCLEAYLKCLLEGTECELKLGPSPYQGLRFFDKDANPVMVARDLASSQIRKRFELEQTVVVVGGSGSGKSSIVRGRVVSEISSQSHPVKGRAGAWYSVVFRPAIRPLAQFLDAFWEQIFGHYFNAGADHDLSKNVRQVVFGGDIEEREARAMFEEDVSMGLGSEGELHDGFKLAHTWVDLVDEAYCQSQLMTNNNLIARPAANILFIIDQFEEIFRNKVDDGQAQIIQKMIRFVHKHKPPGVFLVITMRSEDLHRCTQVSELPDLINDSFYLVDWLGEAQLRQAITEPARRVLRDWGVTFCDSESAPFSSEVVESLLRQVALAKKPGVLAHRSDHLPLFQHALAELWQTAAIEWSSRDDEGKIGPFTVNQSHLNAVVRRSGDAELWISGVLNVAAEEVFREAAAAFANTCPPRSDQFEPRTVIAAALCEMASLEENRRYHREFVSVDDVLTKRLPPIADDSQKRVLFNALTQALEFFCQRRYLVKNAASNGTTSYDVIHEALIRNWKSLSEWVEDEAAIAHALVSSAEGGFIKVRDDDYPLLKRIFAPYTGSRSSRVIQAIERHLGRLPIVGHYFAISSTDRLANRSARTIDSITLTRAWAVKAIEQSDAFLRRDKEEPASHIFDKIAEAWMKKRQRRRAALGFSCLVPAIAIGLVFVFQQQSAYTAAAEAATEAATLEADKYLVRSQLAISSSIAQRGARVQASGAVLPAAHTLAIAYKAADIALNSGKSFEEDIRRYLWRNNLELDDLFRRLVGQTLHVVQTDGLEYLGEQIKCGTVDRKSVGGNGVVSRSYEADFGVIAHYISPNISNDDRFELRFVSLSSGMTTVRPMMFAMIDGNWPRSLAEGTQICLSHNAEILTVSEPNQVAPSVFWIERHKQFGFAGNRVGQEAYLSIRQIQSPLLHTDIDNSKLRNVLSKPPIVRDIVVSSEKNWRTDIFYEIGGVQFRAFFYSGRALPVTVSNPMDVGLEKSDWYSVHVLKDGIKSPFMKWCVLRDGDDDRTCNVASDEEWKVWSERKDIESRFRMTLPYSPQGFSNGEKIEVEAVVPWINARREDQTEKVPIGDYRIILRLPYAGRNEDGSDAQDEAKITLSRFLSEGIVNFAIRRNSTGEIIIAYRTGGSEARIMRIAEPPKMALGFLMESVTALYTKKDLARQALERGEELCIEYECDGEVLDYISEQKSEHGMKGERNG